MAQPRGVFGRLVDKWRDRGAREDDGERESLSQLSPDAGPRGSEGVTPEEVEASFEALLVHGSDVGEGNVTVVVEQLRGIVELLVRGDQLGASWISTANQQLLEFLHSVLLKQAFNRRGLVATQVLQTLSILVQNTASRSGARVLFANDHLNVLLEVDFDFEDEEVLGYYVSLLKAICLRLSPDTAQFFVRVDEQAGILAFPLYTSAVRFAHHPEPMVRAGVRTMVLSILSVSDPYIDLFITLPPARRYVCGVVASLAEQIQVLNLRMARAESHYGSEAMSQLGSQLTEVEDLLSYCSDILSTGHPHLAHVMAQRLWTAVVGPLLLSPLTEVRQGPAGAQQLQQQNQQQQNQQNQHRQQPHNSDGRGGGGGGPARAGQRPSALSPAPVPAHLPMRAACCAYVLERVLTVLSYAPLVNNLLLQLLGLAPVPPPAHGHPPLADGGNCGSGGCPGADGVQGARTPRHASVREGVLSMLAGPTTAGDNDRVGDRGAAGGDAATTTTTAGGGGDDRYHHRNFSVLPAGNALRLMCAAACCRAASPAVLCALGLLPLERAAAAAGGGGRGGCSGSGRGSGGDGGGGASGGGVAAGGQGCCCPLCDLAAALAAGRPAPGVGPDSDCDDSDDAGAASRARQASPWSEPGHGDGRRGAAPAPYLGIEQPLVFEYNSAWAASATRAAAPEVQRGCHGAVGGGDGSLDSGDASDLQRDGWQQTWEERGHGAAGNGHHSDRRDEPWEARPFAAAAAAATPAHSSVSGGGGREQLADLLGDLLPDAPSPGGAGGAAAGAHGGSPHQTDLLDALTGALPPAGHDSPPAGGRPLVEPAGAAASETMASAHGGSADESSPHQTDLLDALTGALPPAGHNSPPAGGRPPVGLAGDEDGGSGGDGRRGSLPSRSDAAPPAGEPAAPAAAPDGSCARGGSGGVNGVGSVSGCCAAAAAVPPHDVLDALFALLPLGTPARRGGRTGSAAPTLLPVPALRLVTFLLSRLCPRACSDEGPGSIGGRRDGAHGSQAAPQPGDTHSSNSWQWQQQQQQQGHHQQQQQQEGRHHQQGHHQQAGDTSSSCSWQQEQQGQQQQQQEQQEQGPSGHAGPGSGPSSSGSSAPLRLAPRHIAALRAHVDGCASAVFEELSGMWCDAILPLVAAEWAAGRAEPRLDASADGLMPLPPPLVPGSRQQQGSGTASAAAAATASAASAAPGASPSASAAAALQLHDCVQRLVHALQLRALVEAGRVEAAPPLPTPGEWERRGLDAREGSACGLTPATAIPCVVCFNPGEEKRVYFSLAGAPLAAVQTYMSYGGLSGCGPGSAIAGHAALAQLLHSSAAVIVAHPSQTRLSAGIVAAVAPLLGADTRPDVKVARWLHVHVRPSVRVLLRAARDAGRAGGPGAGGPGGGGATGLRALVDGHWVLSFPDAQQAETAHARARDAAATLRAVYAELLGALITNGRIGGAEVGGGEVGAGAGAPPADLLL
ncbi:hypothetical protein FOA52_012209 [Chlamydomonas sp. UWO 241]|nr:hypothetical protein FOA52_012209 [Chlamydomonas sp. UWO 241]